ncbi:MAG: pentapeptide repeat-containing protein [Geminocystis sp.]|nr:pentapeptide repeat-containing protein [Geminocystis sp.]MCS7148658.1 pentapeptide repeat-containing protein [Geminocystis sp.]MDW8115072.1 pentapeptide repeat-containing protein [Geminocystis sp.]MDW8464338.1 pentapeptide repeat-containing protein [Geminocystis sp.]
MEKILFKPHKQLQNQNLVKADLKGINLANACLRNSDLTFADLENANLSGADLTGCNLKCANLKGADLTNAILDNADLSYSQLNKANLAGIHARNAKFQNCHLNSANLEKAYLSHADFTQAALNNANLKGANLKHAIFQQAFLTGANLTDANLAEANLCDASLVATEFEMACFYNAQYNSKTLFPQNFDPQQRKMVFLQRNDITLADLLDILNHISKHSQRYLGVGLVAKYWKASQPDVNWCKQFTIDEKGNIAVNGNKNQYLDDFQIQWYRMWVKNYFKLCSHVINNFEDVIYNHLESECCRNRLLVYAYA